MRFDKDSNIDLSRDKLDYLTPLNFIHSNKQKSKILLLKQDEEERKIISNG